MSGLSHNSLAKGAKMSTLKERMKECATFLTAIWGLEDRGLYALVVAQQNPQDENSVWHTYGFKWPKGLKVAVQRIFAAEKEGANVYICPALYSKPERRQEHVAGSYTLWADSDGNAPEVFDGGVPQPTIQVQSSYEKNVHHYWILEDFLDDVESLETGNRSIAHYIDADASGWDATQLLRPPGTTNRKNGLPVRVVSIYR